MQTHCRQREEGVKKGPKTAYILKERSLKWRTFEETTIFLSLVFLIVECLTKRLCHMDGWNTINACVVR